MTDEQPISWRTLSTGMSVVASDGEEVGRLTEVLGDDQKDIFSGISFKEGVLGTEHYVPAAQLGPLSTDRISLTIPSEEAKQLRPFEA